MFLENCGERGGLGECSWGGDPDLVSFGVLEFCESCEGCDAVASAFKGFVGVVRGVMKLGKKGCLLYTSDAADE